MTVKNTEQSKIKSIISLVFLCIGSIVFSSLLSIALFRYNIFSSTPIFFYRGLKIILLTSAVTCMAYAIGSSMMKKLDMKDAFITFLLPISLLTLFFTHIPVTADRSVSIFLLSYMREHQEHEFNKTELENALKIGYIRDLKATEKRINEQISTGTRIKSKSGYKITQKGIQLLNLYDTTDRILEINSTLLQPCLYSSACANNE